MKKTWLQALAQLILAVFILTSSCHAAETARIGVIFAKTGNAAPVCEAAFKAARFSAERLNREGGLQGRPVELVEYDNKSTPIGARAAAQQAIEDGVIGVIGAVYSSHSIAMAPVLQNNRIPMISPISTLPDLTRDKDYIFRVCFNDDFQGLAMAAFARQYLEAKTAVVMTDTTSRYSIGLADVFTDQFTKKGGKVLWEGEYQKNTIDFSAQIREIDRLNADVAFVPGYYRESAYIIKQARLMGLSLVFLGGDGWVNQMYTYGGDYIHGNYYCTQWHIESPLPESLAFVKDFSARFGSITNEPVMALTYDAMMIFAAAVQRAGSFSTKAIRNQLAGTVKHPGVTGPITFDSNGNPIDKHAVILKFDNNDSIYHKTIRP